MKISKVVVSPAELLLMDVRMGKTLSSTPFGTDGGYFYTKTPVFWKGLRGEEFWKRMEHHRVGMGLKHAIEISKRHRESGVALVQRLDGVVEIVPFKCAEMMKERGKLARIIATAPTVAGLTMRAYAVPMPTPMAEVTVTK